MNVGRINWKGKRELILSILKSTTTKREAKEYLTKYRMKSSSQLSNRWVIEGLENKNKKLIQEDFRSDAKLDRGNVLSPRIQAAIFRIPATLSPLTFERMIVTFKTLQQLGVSPILVVENPDLHVGDGIPSSKILSSKFLRFANVLTDPNTSMALHFTPLLSAYSQVDGQISLHDPNQIVIPLMHEIIPVLFPIAYDSLTGSNNIINVQDALKCLCLSLNSSESVGIQKIIFIDPVGGIPSIERDHSSHVFINNTQEYSDIISELHIGFIETSVRDRHMCNLSNMRLLLLDCLSDTTGIILKPDDLLQEGDRLDPVSYNVLTDRPVISSSLPAGRKRTPQVSTSIIKNGFEVKVLQTHHLSQDEKFDGLIREGLLDEGRFVNMINDSFGKPLKKTEYIKRINRSLDCVILIGDYEGAAVVTKEFDSNGFHFNYLDKFAIIQRNQGLPSLADVIFKMMLQLYQNEIIWRSRVENPVNKWYFERCHGSFSEPKSPWKLFFAGTVFQRRYDKETHERIIAFWHLIQNIPGSFD